MIIIGNDAGEVTSLKGQLFKEFEMKDLGRLKNILGIEVHQSQQGIFISQKKYILELLSETGMLDYKPADTLIVTNHGLRILIEELVEDRHRYESLVGRLIYLSHTRPDMAYVVGMLSRFMLLDVESSVGRIISWTSLPTQMMIGLELEIAENPP